jgi:hypothetical protein
VAIAIKTAREMVLLPYTQRTTTERPGGRGGGRGGREGGYGGPGGRGRRDEERSLSADATSNAVADDAPRPARTVIDEVVEVTGTGDGTVTESEVEETVVEGGS